MKKILIVFGTRPEAIKMAPLVHEFRKYPQFFEVRVCVTAQHREMLDQVLTIFEIQPEYDLDIMKKGQNLFDVTTAVLSGLKDVLAEYGPELVLVHGDTTTSLAASLASFFMRIPVGHIEAGLRTYNLEAPWPEEANRQLTDRISQYYFAPTELNKQNLLREKVCSKKIVVTGNTVIDALFWVLNKIKADAELEKTIIQRLQAKGYWGMADVKDGLKRMVLITGHRRENFGEGFISICNAIRELGEKYPEVDFLYPVHLNPNVQKPVKDILSGVKNIFLIEPAEYIPFVFLMQSSYLILTDSGGIQEEAPGLGKPVLVMRDTTERPEGIRAGTVKLVGSDKNKIVKGVSELLDSKKAYHRMVRAHNPYGDGNAAQRIVEYLKRNKL